MCTKSIAPTSVQCETKHFLRFPLQNEAAARSCERLQQIGKHESLSHAHAAAKTTLGSRVGRLSYRALLRLFQRSECDPNFKTTRRITIKRMTSTITQHITLRERRWCLLAETSSLTALA
mmetsp:Transcript_31520/g.76666  ORF Transcript_31520/g.76666 Transcript_31520/m.76666 type:complete len:120 (+) Transcript_31520:223-582(+)